MVAVAARLAADAGAADAGARQVLLEGRAGRPQAAPPGAAAGVRGRSTRVPLPWSRAVALRTVRRISRAPWAVSSGPSGRAEAADASSRTVRMQHSALPGTTRGISWRASVWRWVRTRLTTSSAL